MARLRVGVLISGRGSNLQALIDACAEPDFPAKIVLVIANEPGAQGLDRAARARIATETIEHRGFASREEFDAALDHALRAHRVELICLAGFMRLLTPGFIAAWRDRMINIHPSLLPSFRGLHSHERALEAGVRLHGCTVHFVRAEMDEGPIIVQAAVPVHADDDAQSLAARVLAAEHRCYPLALRLIAEARVHVEGERARIDGLPEADAVLLNPPDRGGSSSHMTLVEAGAAWLYEPVRPGRRTFGQREIEGMSVQHDLQPHLDTWHGFIRMVFLGGAGVVTLLVLMAIFLL